MREPLRGAASDAFYASVRSSSEPVPPAVEPQAPKELTPANNSVPTKIGGACDPKYRPKSNKGGSSSSAIVSLLRERWAAEDAREEAARERARQESAEKARAAEEAATIAAETARKAEKAAAQAARRAHRTPLNMVRMLTGQALEPNTPSDTE